MDASEYIEKARSDNYIEIDANKNKICYKTRDGVKSFYFSGPEENVRAEFYSELIYKYNYETKKIDFEQFVKC